MNPTLPILVFLGLAPFAPAQDPKPQDVPDPKPAPSGLEKARSLFDKVDLDDDGSISAAEAGRSRIPGARFVAHDDDRDRTLSREEFNLFYRDLLVSAGQAVPEDLAAEVSRVEAARRTRKAEEKNRPGPRAGDAAKGTENGEAPPTTEAERVEAARQEAEAARIQKARDDANAQREARIEKARQDAERERDDLAREQAQEPAPQPTGETGETAEADRIAAARAKAEAERIEKARGAKPATEGPGASRRESPAPEATPEQRAAGYVARLVDAGRLTPAQARDYYAFLTSDPKAGQAPPDQIALLREAHTRAKNRISDLVVAGDLSAEEGRQLASALDARARALLPAPAPIEPTRRTAREETPAPRPAPAPERGEPTPAKRGGEVTPPERGGTETPPERVRGGGDSGRGEGGDDAKRGKGKRDAGGGENGRDTGRDAGGPGTRRRDG